MVFIFTTWNNGFDPPVDKRWKRGANELIKQSNIRLPSYLWKGGGGEYHHTPEIMVLHIISWNTPHRKSLFRNILKYFPWRTGLHESKFRIRRRTIFTSIFNNE